MIGENQQLLVKTILNAFLKIFLFFLFCIKRIFFCVYACTCSNIILLDQRSSMKPILFGCVLADISFTTSNKSEIKKDFVRFS